MNCVCVDSGDAEAAEDVDAAAAAAAAVVVAVVVEVEVEVEVGKACTPSACAAGVCVKNANIPSCLFLTSSPSFPSPNSLPPDDLNPCFGGGCSSDRSCRISASLRVFSATRAEWSFCVSWSLRRRVWSEDGVRLGLEGVVVEMPWV